MKFDSLIVKTWASKSKRGKWHLRIEKQDYRETNFNKGSSCFNASNGITLRSDMHPEWLPQINILFVRGYYKGQDFSTITLNKRELSKILSAIKEYNESVPASKEAVFKDALVDIGNFCKGRRATKYTTVIIGEKVRQTLKLYEN